MKRFYTNFTKGILLLFFTFTMSINSAKAVTITVGTSGFDYTNLIDAVEAASSGDIVILMPAGTSFGKSIINNSGARLDTKAGVIIDGNNCTVSNASAGTTGAISFTAGAGIHTLRNITLCEWTGTNGAAIGSISGATGTTWILENVNVFGCSFGNGADAVELRSAGTINVDNCNFNENNKSGLYIALSGGISCNVNISNSNFSCNGSGASSAGHGLYIESSGSHKAHNITLDNLDCSKNNGSGLAIYTGANSVLALSDCVVAYNAGGTSVGGFDISGLVVHTPSGSQTGTVTRCTFLENNGGNDAVYNHTDSNLSYTNCAFIDNGENVRCRAGSISQSLIDGTTIENGLGMNNTSLPGGTPDPLNGTFNIAGVENISCLGTAGCAASPSADGAIISGDLAVGEIFNSTQGGLAGTYSYKTEDGVTGTFTGPIPLSLEGKYVVFWQLGVTGTTPYIAGTVAAIMLPVELTSFTANAKNCEVKLSWQTATEINNAYFEIQRSRDGHTFETIEKMTGAGTTETVQNYQFMDKKPMANNYYRLKQVDIDGQFDYSTIEIVRTNDCHGTGTVNVYPNPVADHLTIEMTTTQVGKGQILIYNYAGKEILNFSADLENGLNTIPLATTNLQSGIYFVQIMNDGQVSELVKFVKR